MTWAQFCSMLGKMIAQYDQSKLEQWEKETADAPNEKMRRDGGMVALLFAAKTVACRQPVPEQHMELVEVAPCSDTAQEIHGHLR
ncbi:MAG: hypothetical protein ACLUGG_01900, partial [Oscillospiraceae bacterium]